MEMKYEMYIAAKPQLNVSEASLAAPGWERVRNNVSGLKIRHRFILTIAMEDIPSSHRRLTNDNYLTCSYHGKRLNLSFKNRCLPLLSYFCWWWWVYVTELNKKNCTDVFQSPVEIK